MKISTKARYGLRIMLELAHYYSKGPVFLKDIAKRQQISEKYLEHILSSLRIKGFVKSLRGAKGGYVLNQHPKDIKVSEIIYTTEGSLSLVECIENPKVCSRYAFCITKEVWQGMKDSMEKYVDGITLQDLVEKERLSRFKSMYNI